MLKSHLPFVVAGVVCSLLLIASMAVTDSSLNVDHQDSPTELAEQFWHSSGDYQDLDNSVKDYVGAQFHRDVESDVSNIIQQWHQAGGSMQDVGDNSINDDDGDQNSDMSNSDNDSENDNSDESNPFSDENAGTNQESEWTTFHVTNDHDTSLRGTAKGELNREIQSEIQSATKSVHSQTNGEHFGNEPSKWLRRSADAFEHKARNIREQTHEMERRLQRDKWISRKWNSGYSRDKVLERTKKYLEKHPLLKRFRHETRMKRPTFKFAKKSDSEKRKEEDEDRRIHHLRPENHVSDISQIMGAVKEDEKKANSGPHIPEKQLNTLNNEIGKQSNWLKQADDVLDGKVKVVKGEISDLKSEVKHLAHAITSRSNDSRSQLMRSVDRNLRKIAESVIHMRAAEREREKSRRAFEQAAESAKHRLQLAKKSVEGVLLRHTRHSHH